MLLKLVNDGVKSLEELGAQIQEVSLPNVQYALPTYYIIAMCEASSNLARYDGIRYGYRTKNKELVKQIQIRFKQQNIPLSEYAAEYDGFPNGRIRAGSETPNYFRHLCAFDRICRSVLSPSLKSAHIN